MSRKIKFYKENTYHVFNRGVRKSDLFFVRDDYLRWEELLYWCSTYNYTYSRYKFRVEQTRLKGGDPEEILEELDKRYKFKIPPIEILAYTWMPNHFHLVLRQISEDGITKFMHRVATAYAKYANERHDLSGALYEGPFEAVWVRTDEQLKQLIRYIHSNALAASLVALGELLDYPWSSLPSYVRKQENTLLTKKYLLEHFPVPERLWEFTKASFDTSSVAVIEDIALDDDFGWYKARELRDKERARKARSDSIKENL